MITGIVAILGAITGLVPSIMQWLSLKETNAHSLALETLRLQAAREGTALQVDLANAQHDIKQSEHIYSFGAGASGVKWIDALAVFVRPYITLVFFHFWLLIEVALFIYGVNSGYDLGQLAKLMWSDETAGIFGAVIGFWFGTRMMTRGAQMSATLAVTKGK
jgi:hypothetical protein